MTAFPRLKLNIGCGEFWKGPPVVNIDCRNLVPPDGTAFLRADVGDLLSYFAPASSDEIWALEVLEHFPQRESRRLLAEWSKLLVPGGVLHLSVPDLEALCRFALKPVQGDRHWACEEVALHIYGGQDYSENFHKAGFTRAWLKQLCEEAGLTVELIASDPRCHTGMVMDARKRGGSDGAGNA